MTQSFKQGLIKAPYFNTVLRKCLFIFVAYKSFKKMIRINNLRSIFATATLLIIGNAISAQEMVPIVYNYGKADYHLDSKTWSVTRVGDGTMCFGNGAGLLIYDGIEWERTKLPGGKTVRSVFSYEDRIYAGGFEEFGWFDRDSTGMMRFTSLSGKLNGFEFQNDDIWTILKHDGKIVFHAFTALFVYNLDDGTIQGHRLNGFAESIGQTSEGKLMCSYAGMSSIDAESGELHPLPDLPFRSRMVTILPYTDHKDIVITLSDGLYILEGDTITSFHTEADRFLRSTRLNRACISENGNYYILGSSSDGCISIDRDGKVIWRLDSTTGLSDNAILGLSTDLEGNIWAATDAGISMILGEAGIKYIASLSPSVGAVYSTYCDGESLYIGTNQGLYIADLDKDKNLHNMHRIPNIEGNVWYIDNFEGQILCGTNGETWELGKNGVAPVHSANIGGTCMSEGQIHGQRVLVQGTYTEPCIFLRQNGRWSYSHRIEGFVQPISSIGIDYLGNIWAAHNEEGLYRMRLDKSLTKIESLKHYPTLREGGESAKLNVCSLEGRIVFADGESFYIYDDIEDRIIPFEGLNSDLGRFSSATHISPAQTGWWFVKEDEAGFFSTSEDSDDIAFRLRYTLPFSIFNSRTVDRRTDIKATGKEGSIVGLYNSLAWIGADMTDSSKTRSQEHPTLILRGIRLSSGNKDETRRAELDKDFYSIPFKYRLIGIDFACPQFSERDKLSFRYILHGRDKSWTELGTSESVNLSHLLEGRYTLELEARSRSGELIDNISMALRIQAPFYRSIVAKILYALAVIGIFALVIITALRHFREQKRELERQRLENELDAKSMEITLSTMNMIRKNELLRDVKKEMEEQKKSLGDAWPDRYYRKVVGSIDKFLDNDDDWEVFEQNFNRIHNGFFKTLKTRYPSLTPSDLRFCAYLCLNLTSKEIASMMNISLKGVEAARYRIRKKLSLPSNISLSEFLMGI